MADSGLVRSAANAKLKAARAMREGRSRDGVLLEGRHLLCEALDAGAALRWVLHDPSFGVETADRQLLEAAAEAGAEVQSCEPDLLRSGSDLDAPAGVLAWADRPQADWRDALRDAEVGHWFLVAGGVQDPGNVGAMVRIAAGLGAAALFALKGGASPWQPRALRGASGNAFRLPVFERVPADEFLDASGAAGVEIWGADAGGEAPSALVTARGRAPLALLLGEEGRGLSAEQVEACTGRVGIPMARGVESLNVATAAAVLAWELRR